MDIWGAFLFFFCTVFKSCIYTTYPELFHICKVLACSLRGRPNAPIYKTYIALDFSNVSSGIQSIVTRHYVVADNDPSVSVYFSPISSLLFFPAVEALP